MVAVVFGEGAAPLVGRGDNIVSSPIVVIKSG